MSKKESLLLLTKVGVDEADDAPGEWFQIPYGSSGVAYVDLTVFSGTNELLDVDIEAKDPQGQSYVIDSITQLAAVGKERLPLPALSDLFVRANPTHGGTSVVATYTVSLVVGG